MDTKKREAEQYRGSDYLNDAAFQSPAEKKKNQQEDIVQNRDEIQPDDNPVTNATLGNGNQPDGKIADTQIDPKDLNP